MTAMTTEHSQAETAAAQPTGSRRLTRRSSDRVIAGVAAGVADYLNIDPLLVRAGFAGLMIFGGAGLVLYFVAWLLIPAEGRAESITEAAFRGLGLRSGRLGRALLVFAAVIVAGVWLRGLGDNQWRDGALFAVLIVTLGILLLRWGDGPRPSNPAEQTMEVRASTSDTAGLAPATPGVPVVAQSPAQQRSRSVPAEQRPRESSPLGWFVVAADLVAVGLLAVVDNLPGLHVTLGQYLGAVLAVLGLGLVLGAWWTARMSTQSSTGLLYVGLGTVLAGEIAARVVFYLTGVAV